MSNNEAAITRIAHAMSDEWHRKLTEWTDAQGYPYARRPWAKEAPMWIALTNAALPALCAGPLPRAVLRRAIEDHLAEIERRRAIPGRDTLSDADDVTEWWLRERLAELAREDAENAG